MLGVIAQCSLQPLDRGPIVSLYDQQTTHVEVVQGLGLIQGQSVQVFEVSLAQGRLVISGFLCSCTFLGKVIKLVLQYLCMSKIFFSE